MNPSLPTVEEAWQTLAAYLEEHDYRGAEPADGNASPLHRLTFGCTLLQRVLQQAVLRWPWDLRPLLRVPPAQAPITLGYAASAFSLLHQAAPDPELRRRACQCLDRLQEARSPYHDHPSWGNAYPYATRSGRLRQNEPILVWTSLIGDAFLDAYEAFGEPEHLRTACGAAQWIMDLPREYFREGFCISYHAFQQTSIHNANMLAAAFLLRAGRLAGWEEPERVADFAMRFSCSRQLPDGAWHYAEDPGRRWIDNFHTGYNLEALARYWRLTGDRSWEAPLRRGYVFFHDRLFDPAGRPRYYHNRTYPLDIQSAAQGIETFVTLAETFPTAHEMAGRLAGWTLQRLRSPRGHFHYRDLGWKVVRTPMMHWGQATMLKALARLWILLRGRPSPAPPLHACLAP